MTFSKTPARKNPATILVASAALALFAVSGAHAADDDVDIVFDDDGYGSNYYECFMDGGTINKTPTTTSCTINGKTTTCDVEPVDEDAGCSTEKTVRVLGGGSFRTGFVGGTSVVSGNQSTSAGHAPTSQTFFTFVKR